MMWFLATSLLIITLSASIFALFFIPKKAIHILLILTGGYLLAISFLYILPAVFQQQAPANSMAVFVLCGFLLQHFLEYFSMGVEHGHIESTLKKRHNTAPYIITLSLMIHSFLEGLAIYANSDHSDNEIGYLFYCSVLLHKVPVSFAFVLMLQHYFRARGIALLFTVLFALCSPLGMLINHHTLLSSLPTSFMIIRALVAGGLLYIATTIFFESSPNHTYRWSKVWMSGLGILLAVLTKTLLH